MTPLIDWLRKKRAGESGTQETAPTAAVRPTKDSPLVYGIDFGTTNTVVAAGLDGQIRPLPLGAGGLVTVPSILLYQGTNISIGTDAIRQFQVARSGESRLIYAMKGALTDARTDPTDHLSKYLGQIKARSDRVTGHEGKCVVLGYPVVFEGAEGTDFESRQRRAKDRLKAAARLAGFTSVELVAEPQAALPGRGLPDGNALCLDFGGGTFDVMVAEISEGHARARSLDGCPIGGQAFDSSMFAACLAAPLGLSREYVIHGRPDQFPAWLRCGFGSWHGLKKTIDTGHAPGILREFMTAPGGEQLRWAYDVLVGGQAHAFLSALEDTKIGLSSAAEAYFELDWPGMRIEETVRLTDFEAAIEESLSSCFQKIDDALAKAELDDTAIDCVVATGGSSQLPAFRRELVTRFGAGKLQEAPAFTAVASGLAQWGVERWAQ